MQGQCVCTASAGDRGFDPAGLCAEAKARTWYQQAELQNGRWAMLGVAGILGQEIINPNQFWYTAGMPEVGGGRRRGGHKLGE